MTMVYNVMSNNTRRRLNHLYKKEMLTENYIVTSKMTPLRPLNCIKHDPLLSPLDSPPPLDPPLRALDPPPPHDLTSPTCTR